MVGPCRSWPALAEARRKVTGDGSCNECTGPPPHARVHAGSDSAHFRHLYSEHLNFEYKVSVGFVVYHSLKSLNLTSLAPVFVKT